MLTVLKYPAKKLKEISKPITKISNSIIDLVDEMFETMVGEIGIGLAAPQVGELVRLAVVDVHLEDPLDPEKSISDPVCLINPEIIAGDGTISYEEGCLSCPELIVKVDRFNRVKVRYLDLEGRPQELTAEGLKAVCIQHELDHLNGILLADKISRLERDLYKNKRIKIAKDEKDLAKAL